MSGIDYGNGLTNIDKATGIRYGVIAVNSIATAWGDRSHPVSPEPVKCSACGGTGDWGDDRDDECQACHGFGSRDYRDDMDPEWAYEGQGYRMRQGNEEAYVWVTQSPYYCLARYCSPCMPGAGNIDEPDEGGVSTYCPGHDWFEGGQAPFTIYSVATNEPVIP